MTNVIDLAPLLAEDLRRKYSPLMLALPDIHDLLGERLDQLAALLVLQMENGEADAALEAVTLLDPDPQWFATPQGQLTARCGGAAIHVSLTRQQAADMLGVTPGTISQLAARGTLPKDADGHIPVSAVADRIDSGKPRR